MKLLLLALAAITVSAETAVPAEAQRLVGEHQFKAALSAYTQLTRSEPNVPGHWIWKARLEAWTKAHRQAEATYALIESRWPSNVEALVGHVYLEMWTERFTPAQDLLRHAAELAPHDVGVLAVRVRLLRLQGKRPEAQLAFASLQQEFPAHPETAELRRELETTESKLQISAGSAIDQIVPGQIGISEYSELRYSAGRDTASVAIRQTQRQSENPTQLAVNYLRREGQNYWLAAHASFSMGAVSTSSSEYGFGAARRLFGKESAGLAYSHMQFHNASVDSLTPSFEGAVGRHSSLTISYSRAWIHKPALNLGSQNVAVNYRATLGKRFILIAGGTASNAVVNQTTEAQLGLGADKSISLGARIRLTPTMNLALDWSRRIEGLNPRWLGMGVALSRSW